MPTKYPKVLHSGLPWLFMIGFRIRIPKTFHLTLFVSCTRLLYCTAPTSYEYRKIDSAERRSTIRFHCCTLVRASSFLPQGRSHKPRIE